MSEITFDSIKKLIDYAKYIKKTDNEYSIAFEKYISFINRSFEKTLNLILFSKLPNDWNNIPDIKIKDFSKTKIYNDEKYDRKIFIPDSKILLNYKMVYKNMKDVRKRNKYFNEWKKENKNQIKSLSKKFISYFDNNLKLDSFKKLYGKDDDREYRKCYYCDITEAQINLLIENKLITTKRLYNRGRHLEVDQKESENGYTKENIVLCCYWCNNAKTDEFSEKEFKVIAEKIREVWKKRLDKINRFKISD